MRSSHFGATKKQRLFAKYLATLGISDAACYIKAGYSETDAAQGASRTKKLPKVQALIEKYTADADFKTIATRREFMDMLSDMARPDATDVDMFGNVKPATNAARLKAVELLNKMRGHEITRTELSGPRGGAIQVQASVSVDISEAELTEAQRLVIAEIHKQMRRKA